MTSAERLAGLLREARAKGELIDILPAECAPRSLQDAYAAAALLTRDQSAIAGYKVGATSARGQSMLGLAEPFFGRILQHTVHHSATVQHVRGVYALEAEVAFIMGSDVAVRARPYAPEELVDAVDAIAPALELNQPSWRRPFEVGGLALIADNGVNAGACIGDQRRDWRLFDLTRIATFLSVDEGTPVEGSSANVLGNPLLALTWLANALPRWGESLKRGQIVLSGATAHPVDVGAGHRVCARFADLGRVEVAFASEVMPRA